VKRRAKDTLTAVEMNRGEVESFELLSGDLVRIALMTTSARVLKTTLKQLKCEESGARTDYSFTCTLKISGREHTLEREVSTQRSFYEPLEIDGVRIWFDAVQDILCFIAEEHGDCRPSKHARLALQDASLRICPEHLHLWRPCRLAT